VASCNTLPAYRRKCSCESRTGSAGDFAALGQILNADAAYVSVHTTNFPAEEIRGQIHRGDLEDE
jgi:hypothetical protein